MITHRKGWPTWLKVLGSLALIVVPAVFMTIHILKTQVVNCEVCIRFEGQDVCRRAQGPTRGDCQRTGQDNACGSLALGMTRSLACSRQEPTRVTFE